MFHVLYDLHHSGPVNTEAGLQTSQHGLYLRLRVIITRSHL
jgi:hypothetical protein